MKGIKKQKFKENYRKMALILSSILAIILFIQNLILFLNFPHQPILIILFSIFWIIITLSVFIISFKLPLIFIFPLKDIDSYISNISFKTIKEHDPWVICYGDLKKHGFLRRKGSHYDKNIAFSIMKGIKEILQNGNVKIATDINISQEELAKNNFILLGGPISNEIIYKLNSFLPVQLVRIDKFGLIDKGLYSVAREKIYNSQTVGVFEIIKNPWNKNKVCVILMGLHREGVKVASVLFKNFETLKKNNYNSEIPAKIAELRKNIDDYNKLHINDLIIRE